MSSKDLADRISGIATKTSVEPTLIYSILGAVGLCCILSVPRAMLNLSFSIADHSTNMGKYDWLSFMLAMIAVQANALFRGVKTQLVALFLGVFVWSVVCALLWRTPCRENVLSYFGAVCCIIFASGCAWGYVRLSVFPQPSNPAVREHFRRLLYRTLRRKTIKT